MALRAADEVHYVVTEPVTAAVLERLNPNTHPLHDLYLDGVPRREIYAEMARRIVEPAKQGKRVCAAFYGHPGVLARPAHQAMGIARELEIDVQMLPAVSALDCLFADLGVDPADVGLQSYEATDFLTRGRRPDPSASLLLWQVYVVGQRVWGQKAGRGLEVLVDYLRRWYPEQHEVVVYEASPFPFTPPSIERVPLTDLARRRPPPQATLYLPPAEEGTDDPEMRARLGLD